MTSERIRAVGNRTMRTAVASCLAVGILTTLGCTGRGEPSQRSSGGAPSTAATACYPDARIPDADLAAIMDGLQLPPGAQVVTGTVNPSNASPNRVVVSIQLCVPSSVGSEALRPLATDVAHALKKTELGSRTAVLYVSDRNPKYTEEEGKLRDGEFQAHSWDGTLPRDAELGTWEAVGG
ncbi:hypothetical protein ACWEQA_34150 [Nocardia sp. NPDC004085]